MDKANTNYESPRNVENAEACQKATVDRQWVALTAYQPVDIVTKTVEVPVIKTVEKIVPKIIIQEKIVHVPKNVTHVVEKIVEVPEVKYIEKVVEVPHIHYKNKYVPKVEVVEKIVERQKVIEKWNNKIVEVPQIKEVLRYKEIEDVEEIIKYIPKNSNNINWEAEYKKYLERKSNGGYIIDDATAYQQQLNIYNAFNEQGYQNAYDRSTEYTKFLNENISDYNKDYLNLNAYYEQLKGNNEQTGNMQKTRFNYKTTNTQMKRLPSEDSKPVGCCSRGC